MNNSINEVFALFNKKINVLIVDDDQTQLFIHKEMLKSPLFNIQTCSTLEQAQQCIESTSFPWHCWVIDINLGAGKSGLQLLDLQANYPFVIVLSGLRSLKIGSDAIKHGAMSVFDKDLEEMDSLYKEICKIAALGYLLNGKPSQYLPVFSLLKDNNIDSIENWAEEACLTIRQLQRICALHSSLTPRHAISLYNTIYYLLVQGVNFLNNFKNALDFDKQKLDFYNLCINNVLKKDSLLS